MDTETPSTSGIDQILAPSDTFVRRHIGPSETEIADMLRAIGLASLDDLSSSTIPASIRLARPLALGEERAEHELLIELKAKAAKNKVMRSFIGMGYYGTITPGVIQRNILENPGWYTAYTPYQAEIAQGRLEALINFQTMVSDLTGLELANASLLDEATAAAEAMHMCQEIARGERKTFMVAADCHPQTIAVVKTRAEPLGYKVVVAPAEQLDVASSDVFGVLLQIPATDGKIVDHRALIARAKEGGALVTVATDLLALTLMTPPGELGADIAIGSSQRFGVPMGFGGPHAAFMSTREEHKRKMPGRIIGVSHDSHGNVAYRLAIQTREQHIRREKATSNICTAQVLLAVMASTYAVYHGPAGLKAIARRVRALTGAFVEGLARLGYARPSAPFFDTVTVPVGAGGSASVRAAARHRGFNLRDVNDGTVGISFDETTTIAEVEDLLVVFAAHSKTAAGKQPASVPQLAAEFDEALPEYCARTSAYLTHPVFNSYDAEHELLRYLNRLQQKDISLVHSMIPLGSCTMKLNATAEMVPVTWPEFGAIHPFAPAEDSLGYQELFDDLERWLAEITGFAAVSLQPNAGSQGEYAGLLAIHAYHADRGEGRRKICLIPVSAHGTNPASAVLAGFEVVAVACDASGNVDLADLEKKAAEHRQNLGALMITYPSTHGVFEQGIKQITKIVHDHGGQVYLDGANMNAQVGLCRPGDYGADVCHLNLHKTFCIPHGGGGPGMGPIGVASHLAPFLPGHPVTGLGGKRSLGPVSAAPYGSPSILPISWVYIALMGADGLKRATEVAILNANYMARRLSSQFKVLYSGPGGRVAHEFILDLRPFKVSAGIEVEDFAKRLMDFGFHAPTMSFPVPGTMMIEPTESESKAELDRLCDALLAIREEIRAI